ncbi:MAG: hypothetical protein AB1426_06800 [Bacillota bacterium]
MSNRRGPRLGLPAIIALFLASTNQDVERYLERFSMVLKNTQEAIRSIRQGVQTIQQSLLPHGNTPAGSQPGQQLEDGVNRPKLL